MQQVKRLCLLWLLMALGSGSYGQQILFKKKENIVYGMVSGAALLMDQYVPAKPNKKAIVYIPGSAWGYVYAQNYDHETLKDDVMLDSVYTGRWVASLVENGYTVFVINHRFSPAFQYQPIIEDCRRAVRFVRYHAKDFSIDPDNIGAMGHSSGGNLSAMLGVSDTVYSENKSPVDSVSSKVQAVVTLAAPFNLANFNRQQDTAMANNFVLSVISAYMGSLPKTKAGDFVLSGKFAAASPLTLVTSAAAPALIYYSDNDPLIPARQAVEMYEKLKQQNVPAKLVAKRQEGHNPVPDMAEVNNWFKTYLQ